ncbi:NAD(P)-dependent oxidoreductase [Acuticoccus sp. M5D2P5]|uniref:NAD(P)-dependent oxidoreductase n=1 Tax=Acuticoccus kalidii TaxID=2910977 RepID=UPI001F21D0AF|nr:NAD(P)-dependent oxidoreductase [Acuticoccus kalidii]
MERLGFVGVGFMGEGMAANALKAGHPVTVVAHKKRDAVERLVAAGANEVDDLETLARNVDVIGICVSDAPAVENVIDRLEPGLRPGQLVIDTSTSDPNTTRRLYDRLAQKGVHLVDAPITGSPANAAAGELSTLLGAADEDVDRASAIVGTWSQKVRRFGGVGAGHTAKLMNNFVTQGTTALLAEAYTRARAAGVDWNALHDVMSTGAGRSGTFDKMVTPAMGGDYDGAKFSLRNAAKDVRYYRALTEEMDGEPSPLASVVLAIFTQHVEDGHGDLNISRLLDPALAPKG